MAEITTMKYAQTIFGGKWQANRARDEETDLGVAGTDDVGA
jgi:hypothetical protein